MYKFEMHIHTSECDKAANVCAADIVRSYADAGYSGMIVTDHFFSTFYDWFAEELCGADTRKINERRLKGYYAAREAGEKIGFDVLPGAEVRFDGTINDYLVYGADEDFFLSAPLLNKLNNIGELIEVLPKEACVVWAHPFRNKMTVCDPSPFFGIEVYNGGTESYRNEMARGFAEHYGKAMTSGSDFHGMGALGKGGIATSRRITSPKELTEVLRNGRYSLICDQNII